MAKEIAIEVHWTKAADKSFQKKINYLQKEWTDKEIEKFVTRTQQMIAMLKEYPEMCRLSAKKKNVRIGILDNHTQIIYHYKPGSSKIEILLFWGMKRNPAKFKY